MKANQFTWTPQAINLQDPSPQKLEITSSYLIEGNNSKEGLFHIHNNLIGMLGGYACQLDVFDTEKGEVVLTAKHTSMLGGIPLFDNGVLYVGHNGLSGGSAWVAAYELATQKELWRCKLTNSSEQFGTSMVQTPDMIIAPNVAKDTLFFIDKKTNKLTTRLKMQNAFEGGRGCFLRNVAFSSEHNVYIVAYMNKGKQFVVDCYNAQALAFETTIFEFPKGDEVLKTIQVDSNIYSFTNTGMLYKISLAEGKLVAQAQLGAALSPKGYRTIQDMTQLNGMLKIVAYHSDGDNESGLTIYTYDMQTDKLVDSLAVPEVDEDYTIVGATSYSNILLRYGYGEPSKNGLAFYDVDSKKTLSELLLPNYVDVTAEANSGNDECSWRIEHTILGNAIYLTQQHPQKEKLDYLCVLHRIQ